jgi:SNF2 family DNA or RNA helicase
VKYNPHDYQRYAAAFIEEHPVSYLLLDMGLGKTAITLTAVHDLLFDSFQIRKVLVIAPLRVARDTWPDEVQKWDHLALLRYSVAVGTEAERIAALRQKADIYVINRENVQWLAEESGIPFDYDFLVVDEISSFKNHQSKRWRSLMKVRPRVKRIVGLTGTPNDLMALWAQFRLLDLGQRLGRFIGPYRANYFTPDKRNGQVIFSYKPLPGAEQKIYDLISDITISMKAADYLTMPKLVSVEHTVRLSDAERERYDGFRRNLMMSLGGSEITVANTAVLSGKLSQMANGAMYDDDGAVHHIHDRKLDALEDLLEAAGGKPVMVAYWFKHDLERITERLRKLHIPFSRLDTSQSISRWNAGELPVALIHPASAGHGLNLQSGGNTIIWFGLTWSLELYLQLIARLYRQGQKADTVVVQHIIAKGTIDERIMKVLQERDTNQTALIDAVKAVLCQS